MKFILISLLATVIVGAEGFFFSSSQSSEECAWLPWDYLSCRKIDGGFRKLEERKKIALHGIGNCNAMSETRTTQSCTPSEFITSTILANIKSREAGFDLFRSGEKCRETYTDPATGTKMLGDDNCETRRRRSTGITTLDSAKFRIRRQFRGTAASTEHRDVLFLIDDSGSVGEENFNKEREFVEVIARKFSHPRHIAQDATRVAVTAFSSTPQHHITFDDSDNFGSFKEHLRTIRFRGGGTCMIDALEAVKRDVFQTASGSRVQKKTADGLIILVTDGCFNCHNGNLETLLQTKQKEFESIGVSIVAFMITVDDECEDSLKALSDGSSCFRGFSYASWEAFADEITKFREMSEKINQWTKEDASCP